jgi:hypothetical protein
MGVKVAGLWELNWNIPLNESHLWTFPLREFDIMDWAMCPITGIKHNESSTKMTLTEYQTSSEMVEEFSGDYVRVFVDEKGETTLDEFEHPENAVYFFGNAGRSPMESKRDGDLSVRLQTVANNGVMWPHQILVAVMYDRQEKRRKAKWQSQ